MTNLEIAAIATTPSWLICLSLWQQDRIRAWRRTWYANRLIRLARRADKRARRRHLAVQRMVGSL